MEKIGLQAILDDRDFQRGLQSYLRGMDRAEGATTSAQSSIGRAWSGMGSMIQTAFGFVIGNVIVDGFKRLSGVIMSTAGDAYEAVATFQTMGMAYESMLARELKLGEERTIQQQQRVSLTEKEREKLEDLRQAQEALLADIPAAEARLEAAIARGNTDPRIIAEREQALEAQRRKLAEITAAIAMLEAQDGRLVTVEKQVRVGQMEMNEAMEAAVPLAKELLQWTKDMALVTPFEMQDVFESMRSLMAYGFGYKEAQRMVQAMADWAAGSGATGDAIAHVGLALGQIKAKGKLAGQEVLQLVNAGIDVRNILARAFNKSTEEIARMQEEGLLPAREVVEAIVASMEEDFPGAARKMAFSWRGLKGTLSDIKALQLDKLFGTAFERAEPYVARVLGWLTSPAVMARLERMGQRVGDFVGQVLSLADARDVPDLLTRLGLSPEAQANIGGMADTLGRLWEGFQQSWLAPSIDSTADSLGRIADAAGRIMAGDLKGALEALGVLPGVAGGVEEAIKGWEGLADIIGHVLSGDIFGRKGKAPTRAEIEAISAQRGLGMQRHSWEDHGKSIAEALVEGVLDGLMSTVSGLDRIAAAFYEWARSSETQERVHGAGVAVGEAVVAAVAKLLSSDEAGKVWAVALAEGFYKAIKGAWGGVGELASGFGGGVAEGIAKGITSEESARQWGEAVQFVVRRFAQYLGPGGAWEVIKDWFNLPGSPFYEGPDTQTGEDDRIPGIIREYNEPIPGYGGGKPPPILGYQQGGVIPGPLGAPRMILAHAGEEVLSLAQRVALMRPQASAGLTIGVINVNAPGGDPAVVRRAARLGVLDAARAGGLVR